MKLSTQLHNPGPRSDIQASSVTPSDTDLLHQASSKVEQAFVQNSNNPYRQSLALQQIKNDYLAERYNIQPNSVQL